MPIFMECIFRMGAYYPVSRFYDTCLREFSSSVVKLGPVYAANNITHESYPGSDYQPA